MTEIARSLALMGLWMSIEAHIIAIDYLTKEGHKVYEYIDRIGTARGL